MAERDPVLRTCRRRLLERVPSDRTQIAGSTPVFDSGMLAVDSSCVWKSVATDAAGRGKRRLRKSRRQSDLRRVPYAPYDNKINDLDRLAAQKLPKRRDGKRM